jgi:phytoene synthase
VTDQRLLAAAYEQCRQLTAVHGRTYYLATRLLDPVSRPAVYALYGFARVVDDIVDEGSVARFAPEEVSAQLDAVEAQLRAALDGQAGRIEGPVLALADTARRYCIDDSYFWAFLRSMRMDVPGTPEFRARYQTMAELDDYMYGSAAVIGLQMLPVLGTVGSMAEAAPGAAALGEAFQLTNFLRDVGDDYRRGRIYLPMGELEPFGVTEELLQRCLTTGTVDPRLRRALAHLIAMNRSLYRRADAGIALLDPKARPCIQTASTLYSAILDEIERNGYQVLTRRAVVPRRRRLRWAAPGLARTALRRPGRAAPS